MYDRLIEIAQELRAGTLTPEQLPLLLVQTLQSFPHETTLDLRNLGSLINADEWVRVVAATLSDSQIRSLILIGANSITPQGIQPLANAMTLPGNRLISLEMNGLYNRDFNVDGVPHLSKALQHPNCQLISLHLNDNELDDIGIINLAEGLQHPNCKIQSLSLHHNRITPVGLKHLANVLQQPGCTITHLVLSENRFDTESAQNLATAIKLPHSKLQSLQIQRSHIDELGMHAINNCFRQRLVNRLFEFAAACHMLSCKDKNVISLLWSFVQGGEMPAAVVTRTIVKASQQLTRYSFFSEAQTLENSSEVDNQSSKNFEG